MIGPCAKKQVKCTLVTPDGERFVGENLCNNAQSVCPRLEGEGYEKCKTVCDQPGHAEAMALQLAGAKAYKAKAYLEGIGYACRDCQEKLFSSGVDSLSVGPPPSATFSL